MTERVIRTTPLEQYLLGKVPTGTTVPVYGSWAFDALAAQDPRRAASIILAARIQRLRHDPEVIATDLRWELEQDRIALRQASWDVAGYASEHPAGGPSYAELQHRRGELTDQQLEQYQRECGEFITGQRVVRPTLPKPGRSAA